MLALLIDQIDQQLIGVQRKIFYKNFRDIQYLRHCCSMSELFELFGPVSFVLPFAR